MFTGVRRHGAARPAVYSGVPGVSDKSTVRNFRADCLRELKKSRKRGRAGSYRNVYRLERR